VPEKNFWTLWSKGRLTEADTPSIRPGATPSGLTSAHLHYPPIFYRTDALPGAQATVSKHWRQLAHARVLLNGVICIVSVPLNRNVTTITDILHNPKYCIHESLLTKNGQSNFIKGRIIATPHGSVVFTMWHQWASDLIVVFAQLMAESGYTLQQAGLFLPQYCPFPRGI